MVQRTVLKVRLSCEKRRTKILKSVSEVDGVDKIEIDVAKETLTVTGEADPYAIIIQVRKVIKCVEVVTVGPPPNKPIEKKPEPNVISFAHMPHSCVACTPMTVIHTTQDPCTTCSIM